MNFSFENELTFAPKLNSLSLKLAGVNRTSIIERSLKKKHTTSYTTLDSYTFQPEVSDKSAKIVAKLKTGFFERQKLHTKRQKEKIEQGPSTIHPNFKKSKEIISEKGSRVCRKLSNSISDQTCHSLHPKKLNPYSKSVETIRKEKRKQIQHEIQKICSNFNKERLQAKVKHNSYVLLSSDMKKTEIEVHSMTEISVDSNQTLPNKPKAFSSASSEDLKRLKDYSLRDNNVDRVLSSVSDEAEENHHTLSQSTCKPNDGRESERHVFETDVVKESPNKRSKIRNKEMDLKHQKWIKTREVASQAIKNKKVFLCNGPYYTLREGLRRRSWVEKYFRGDTSSYMTVKDEKKEENVHQVNQDEETNDSGFSSDENIKKPVCEAPRSNNNDNDNDTCEISNEVFASNSQYGIMSRVVRNAIPTFVWTLKRDDINFRFLHRDQIVNHYASAWTFTTKSGLSTHLRDIVAFDTKDWSSFFPRCYRLCCEYEKQEFIDDYRVTTMQCILKLVILRHQEWREWETKLSMLSEELQNCYEDFGATPTCSRTSTRNRKTSSSKTKKYPIILPANLMTLVLKKCYMYLAVKSNEDIEEGYETPDESIEDIHWSKIIDYYKQIINRNAVIPDAWEYVGECKGILGRMKTYCPQMQIDGHNNLWILKPGAKSRGRGIEIMHQLNDISKLVTGNVSQKENRWVLQKYIERPLLVYRTKFDIRQWFLVTDWNPLMIWFYKDCYIRFCGQEFTLTKFDAQVHLSNNSVQRHFQNGVRSEHLPESNMWSSDTFKEHLCSIGKELAWEEKIYPGMKSAIISALRCCQNDLEYRKNSFELYGADFMLCENLNPWLIEINSSPALSASTPVTAVLCRNVLEDTLKVILDRRENKQCDTGRFELAFRQPYISIPSYMGCNIAVEGLPIRPPHQIPLHRAFNIKAKGTEPSVSTEVAQSSSVDNVNTEHPAENREIPVSTVEKTKHSLPENGPSNPETDPVIPDTFKPDLEVPMLSLMYIKNETNPAVSRLNGIVAKLNLSAASIHKTKAGRKTLSTTTFSVEEMLQLNKLNNKSNTNDAVDENTHNNNSNNNSYIEKNNNSSFRNGIKKWNSSNCGTTYKTEKKNINQQNASKNNSRNCVRYHYFSVNSKNCESGNNRITSFSRQEKPKSPSPVSVPRARGSPESIGGTICPQRTSYDLRKPSKGNQSQRVKAAKLKDKQRRKQHSGRYKGGSIATMVGYKWHKRFGLANVVGTTDTKQSNDYKSSLASQHTNGKEDHDGDDNDDDEVTMKIFHIKQRKSQQEHNKSGISR